MGMMAKMGVDYVNRIFPEKVLSKFTISYYTVLFRGVSLEKKKIKFDLMKKRDFISPGLVLFGKELTSPTNAG